MDSKNDTKIEEHVYPEGGYGWVIVFAIILLNVSLLTLIQCFGIIFGKDFELMGVTAAQTSFLLHLQSSLYCITGFFGSPLLKQYEFRTVAFIGTTIWCTGILLTSFGNSYTAFIFTISVLTGIGQGILMPSTYLATNSYFKERLTLAVSISTTGASIFSIVSPKLCDILVSKVGRKYTVLVLFGLSLLSYVGCFLMRPIQRKKVEHPEELTKLETSQPIYANEDSSNVYKETTQPIKRNPVLLKLINVFDLELLKKPSFIIAIFSLGVSFAAELNMVLMMQFVLPELSKFSRTDVANITSVQFIFDILGRLVVPFACHSIHAPPKWVYAGALIAATGARTLLATYAHSYTAAYAACCIIGVTKGLRAVYQSVIIPKLVPLEKFVAANGLQMFFTGAVSLAIGPLIGSIHDHFNSYVPALHASSILSCACVLLWILEAIFSRKNENNE
ncbi:monocarboxylate transporter 3-like [Diabrotica undecimpunctata]|uniref:monocarboxylate transporter 3-like n=1 Tax=Diabrotica undecimpunctata TaxID=50387 RepID=UPI003B63F8CA